MTKRRPPGSVRVRVRVLAAALVSVSRGRLALSSELWWWQL